METIDLVSEVYTLDRISVRLGPTGRFNDMYDSDPDKLMEYVLKELSKKNLQFVEIKRHGFIDKGAGDNEEEIDSKG